MHPGPFGWDYKLRESRVHTQSTRQPTLDLVFSRSVEASVHMCKHTFMRIHVHTRTRAHAHWRPGIQLCSLLTPPAPSPANSPLHQTALPVT